MKLLLTLLLATLCAATSYGQTIKTLGFNTTNGLVVANTGTNVLTFSAPIQFTANQATVGLVVTDEALTTGYDSKLGSLGFGGGDLWVKYGTNDIDWGQLVYIGSNGISFSATSVSAATRTNLGIPLAALTNTSNVTMMRALSGSTNTNHPFSGSVSVVGTNNTNVMVFSNGVLQSVQ